jgi:glycosyltransferase involved in cell wall biosynthesis
VRSRGRRGGELQSGTRPIKVLVATGMWPTDERPYFGTWVRTQVASLNRAGLIAEPFVLTGSGAAKYARAVPALRRRLASGDIDVVHAHYSYVGVVARTQLRVPIVVTFHGDDLLGTPDELGKTLLLSRWIAAGGAMLARVVDAVIVQSEQMRARLPRVRDVHVIPCEIDLELFRPIDRDQARRELGLDPTRRLMLFAASPAIPRKRFPLAREALEVLQQTDPDVELVVVHDEPQHRVPLYMNACDALVLTSFHEGSPNVVKQAMACNLPVVSTDVGDVRQVIDGTQGCAIVPPEAAAVATGLRTALAVGRTHGRERVVHLGGDIIAAKVSRVYSSVLGRVTARNDSRSG